MIKINKGRSNIISNFTIKENVEFIIQCFTNKKTVHQQSKHSHDLPCLGYSFEWCQSTIFCIFHFFLNKRMFIFIYSRQISFQSLREAFEPQALVSFKKYMPPPLPYFKVNICSFPLPHFASIFFVYL